MAIVLYMFLGAFIGWLTGAIEEVDEGILARMGIGMLGGLIGHVSASMLTNSSMLSITWLSTLLCTVSAFILLSLVKGSTHQDSRDRA